MLVHRDRVEQAKLTQNRETTAVGGDDLVGGVLGLIDAVAAPTQQVLSIKLQGVRSKLTIEGKCGAPECEWLQRALGHKLGRDRV